MAESPKKPAKRRPASASGAPAKRRPQGKRPPGKPGGAAPPNRAAGTKGKKGAGKSKKTAPKPIVFGPAYRFGSALTLSLVALTLSIIGLAVLHQGLSISLSRGLTAVTQPSLAVGGMLLGGFVGLVLSWLLAARAKWLIGSLMTLIITGGMASAGQALLPGMVMNYVAATPPTQKQAALKAAFLHQSAAAGALQVTGLPTDINLNETKSFVVGISALAVIDPGVFDRMDSNLDRLADTIMARGLTEQAAWRRFQEAVNQTQRDFNRYRQAADKVLNIRDNIDREAFNLWEAVSQSAEARWADYDQRRNEAIRQLNARVPAFRDLLSVYFRVRQRGADMREMKNRYNNFSTELFGQYVDPQSWCGLSGCPGTLDYIQDEATKILSATFQQNSNGLTLDLDEFAYYEHPSVRTILQEEVAAQGVNLPADWVLNAQGRITLIDSARRDLPVSAETLYNRTMDEWFATTLSPDLNYMDFVAQEGIQDLLRQSLRLPREIRIDPTIDQPIFAADYFPRIKRPAMDALAGDMRAPLEDFGDAARLTESADKAMQTAIALPIAMFAGGVTGVAGFLIGSVLFLLALIRLMARLIKMPEAQVVKVNWVGRLSIGTLLVVTLGAPMLLGAGVASYPAYSNALSPAVMSNPMIGIPASWTMRMAGKLENGGQFAQQDLLGGRQFGMIPASEIDADGFSFAYEFDDSDPTVIEEPDRGPAGITGIRDRLEGLIDNASGG